MSALGRARALLARVSAARLLPPSDERAGVLNGGGAPASLPVVSCMAPSARAQAVLAATVAAAVAAMAASSKGSSV